MNRPRKIFRPYMHREVSVLKRLRCIYRVHSDQTDADCLGSLIVVAFHSILFSP